jgi:1-aminocyclopropane-1-carboxylate deaminase/D-cysteine desulfhydrase-like pyridoxal-dependent ACC family enzyme
MFPAPTYPTPVVECAALSGAQVRLWVKNDGMTHPIYGGNKVRKMSYLVREAQAHGARRILTFGAAGSHHVLTTALFARAHGLGAAAVVLPQPTTSHVTDTLRASVGQGVELYPVRSAFEVPWALLRGWKRGDYVVPPGGSSVIGTLGYVDAVDELVSQIRGNVLPEPDLIVTAVGSGGTCAGLLAGVALHGLKTSLLGVLVVSNPLARQFILRLALQALALRSPDDGREVQARRLELTSRYVGPGYGGPTPEARDAVFVAKEQLGLALDMTYTAKAFAAVQDAIQGGRYRNILYWHTLSSPSLAPLLAGAPSLAALPANVRRLLA